MKAILVIDMPDDVDISKVIVGGDGNIYFLREGERASVVGNIKNIKPMPEKKVAKIVGFNTTDYVENKLFADGWNACLEELEK